MIKNNIPNAILFCLTIVITVSVVIYILFSKSNRAKKANKIAEKNYKRSKIFNGAYNENSSVKADVLYDYLKEKKVKLNYLGLVSLDNVTLENHFDNFWFTAIFPSIKKCHTDMSKDFIRECRVEIKDLNEYRQGLQSMYKRKREWLKREYLPHSKNPLLDFHKLASVICRCIIGIKPVSYNIEAAEHKLDIINADTKLTHNEKLNWIVSNIYVNYKIAFLAAIGIVYSDLIYWAYEKSDTNKIEKSTNSNIYIEFADCLVKRKNLVFYPNPLKHENFIDSTIIALVKGDLLQRDFDYLFLSIIFYQIQENTKLNLFNEILKKDNMDSSNIELT